MDRNSSGYFTWRNTCVTVYTFSELSRSYSSLLINKYTYILQFIHTRKIRVAASQLNTLGCPELIARNRTEYEQIAIRLGNDREYLRSMRHKVWKARADSPLFDCKQYATGLECLFSRMWDRHSRGEIANHITDTTVQK